MELLWSTIEAERCTADFGETGIAMMVSGAGRRATHQVINQPVVEYGGRIRPPTTKPKT
jgi:hypothetical protein|tara:strand:+ start:16929 stop:17105 length:177 start_codon:yes stop_codon:yes gene_type:complete